MGEIDVSKCMDYNSFCYKARQLCKDVDSKYCIHKQLQQLKAENEELKKDNSILKDTVKIQARTIDKTQSDWFNNFSEMKNKYELCLDEIEEICKPTICGYPINIIEKILQLIKQAKEIKE